MLADLEAYGVTTKNCFADFLCTSAPVVQLLGRGPDLAVLLQSAGATWSGADDWYDELLPDAWPGKFRPRGSDEYGYDDSVEAAVWVVKLAHVMSTCWDEVDPAEDGPCSAADA
jgi:hypothetical protein